MSETERETKMKYQSKDDVLMYELIPAAGEYESTIDWDAAFDELVKQGLITYDGGSWDYDELADSSLFADAIAAHVAEAK
jgi:hypothetical protein